MKTLLIFIVTFLALVSITLAQEVTTTPTGAQIGTIKAGTTPDSFLYGLDVSIDQLRYLLTFDNTAKTRVGLEIARERLLEVREMVIENKVEALQKAQNEYVKTLEKVKTSVTALSRDNSTQEIKEVIELERELEGHEDEVETVSEELKIKIKVKGEITPEQQVLIDSVLNLMQDKTGEVKIKIENKKGETKIKIKAETGKTETEIENEVEDLEEKSGLTDIKQKKAQEQIEEALEELNEIKVKLLAVNVTQFNVTAVNELLFQAEQRITNAQDAFNETKFGEAFGQANAAEQLSKNADKILERFLEKEEEEEKEIEVEIEEGVAKVKVEIGDNKLKYILPTTNENEVLNDISSKTGLSIEEVTSIAEVEVEEQEPVESKEGPETVAESKESESESKGKSEEKSEIKESKSGKSKED